MEAGNLNDELYREYEWRDPVTGEAIIYKIDKPVALYYERGHTCHRVVDSKGVTHCIPAVGYFGCVLRWKVKPNENPVAF